MPLYKFNAIFNLNINSIPTVRYFFKCVKSKWILFFCWPQSLHSTFYYVIEVSRFVCLLVGTAKHTCPSCSHNVIGCCSIIYIFYVWAWWEYEIIKGQKARHVKEFWCWFVTQVQVMWLKSTPLSSSASDHGITNRKGQNMASDTEDK